MRLLFLLPTVALSCLRTATPTVTNRASVSQDAQLAARAPFPCTLSPFRLCLEGWICDSTSISISNSQLKCEDGSAILVKEGNTLVLATKTECKDKRWLINEKSSLKEVEATCGSIVPRGKSLRKNDEVSVEVQTHNQQQTPTTPSTTATPVPQPRRATFDPVVAAEWNRKLKEIQDQIRENDQRRRIAVMSLVEMRKNTGINREALKRMHDEIVGHNAIRHELTLIQKQLREDRRNALNALRYHTTPPPQRTVPLETANLLQSLSSLPSSSPPIHPGTLPSSHIPSYAELLALQGYEAMPQIYTPPPRNPFDEGPHQSIENLPLSLFSLLPYTSYRRCGRILQSTSDCPDGRICSSYSHLGEHRITCPNGHVAIELPEGHLELMVSSLVCPEGGSEWTAESDQGQRGQRVGRDLIATCIQECACTPLSASPVCPPSQRCSPASFMVDMDDQCMLYECEEGKNLYIRTRYGWQPASHLVCGPGGEYLAEGKDKVGSSPTVTCVVDSPRSPPNKRKAQRRKVYAN